MDWILLVIAGVFETVFAYCLGKAKTADGPAVVAWYVGFAVALCMSMGLLVKAVQTLPVGTAYAVWTGIGAAGTVLVGIVVFKEPASMLRLFFLFTLISSIIGLKVVSQ